MSSRVVGRRVAIFCGSRPGEDSLHADHAAELAAALAERGVGIVYGGGHVGLMGAVADAALAAGGEVIGVIPEALVDAEIAHSRVTKLVQVATMHERKATMGDLADGFVMLPGGFGTLDEFFEAVTWAQLRIHTKPCVVVDPDGYFRALLDWIDAAVVAGFVAAKNRPLVRVAHSVADALELLEIPAAG